MTEHTCNRFGKTTTRSKILRNIKLHKTQMQAQKVTISQQKITKQKMNYPTQQQHINNKLPIAITKQKMDYFNPQQHNTNKLIAHQIICE